jgi:hypothetical protein
MKYDMTRLPIYRSLDKRICQRSYKPNCNSIWLIGDVILFGIQNEWEDDHFMSFAWATLKGYERHIKWTHLDRNRTRSRLYSKCLPGESEDEHNWRITVRGTQAEYAAFLGLGLSPVSQLGDTRIRSTHADLNKDILLFWNDVPIRVEVKTSPRIGLVDNIFCNHVDNGYKGSPGYNGEPGCLFVPSWQGLTADVYIHLLYDRHPLSPNNVDCMTYELAGAATKDMLRVSSRGRCTGYEVPRSSLIEVNDAFDRVCDAYKSQLNTHVKATTTNAFSADTDGRVDTMLPVRSSGLVTGKVTAQSNAQHA